MNTAFTPTSEQRIAIRREGTAFVMACPGAGKTRVIVERTRHIVERSKDFRGICFLSFTRAAVEELAERLRSTRLVTWPPLPHFIGTFDSFIWQFLVAPLGIPGIEAAPRLIPDLGTRLVRPFPQSQALPLSCFSKDNGSIVHALALRHGFNVNKKKPSLVRAYETSARRAFTWARERGALDYDDARTVAQLTIGDQALGARLTKVLVARFKEIIIDEAQDCNPSDLNIIRWFIDSGIPTKVICDPHQSIYEFRGGITTQLVSFANSLETTQRLSMRGNFRSTPNICKAISMLREPSARDHIDTPLGRYREDALPVYILSYSDKAVPVTIGTKFAELLRKFDIDPSMAPVVAATRESGAKAIGLSAGHVRRDITYRLAKAVSDFRSSIDLGEQKRVLESVHEIILDLRGMGTGLTYHQYLDKSETHPEDWRPEVLQILSQLRYDTKLFSDSDAWLSKARTTLAPLLPVGCQTIAQRLRKNGDIASILADSQATGLRARTIHSVKGLEFPAICVITVAQTLNRVLDFLESGSPTDSWETARELYVAASRAERLLVFACPKKQATRLAKHLQGADADILVLEI